VKLKTGGLHVGPVRSFSAPGTAAFYLMCEDTLQSQEVLVLLPCLACRGGELSMSVSELG